MEKKLLKNQKGQGIMEYIILGTLVGIFCLATVGEFGKTLKNRVEFMKKSIVKHIKIDN